MGNGKHGRALARGRSSGDRRHSSGQTLLEVLVGFSVLLVGLVGFVKVIVSSMEASRGTHDAARAKEAARGMLETLAAQDFDTLFETYNEDPADDPGGNGTAPGADFAVEGLSVQTSDADGLVGEILFPTKDGAPGVLREDQAAVRFGTPRDLNGDGAVDDADHSDDYEILPVAVRISWRGAAGNNSLEMKTVLGGF